MTFVTINCIDNCWASQGFCGTFTAERINRTLSGINWASVSRKMPMLKLNPQSDAIRRSSLWGFAMTSGNSVLNKETESSLLSEEVGPHRHRVSRHHDPEILSLQTVGNDSLLFTHHPVYDRLRHFPSTRGSPHPAQAGADILPARSSCVWSG